MPDRDFPPTKRQIMDVAIDLLLRNSYANVNISAIAQECGISKPAIYYYFENKEDLVRECLKEVLDDVNTIVLKHSEKRIPLREKLTLICIELLKAADEKHGMLAIFLRSITEPELKKILDGLQDQMNMYLGKLREIFSEGIAQGEIRKEADPRLAALMLTGTFLMYMQSGLIFGIRESLEPSDVADMLLDGISTS